MTNFELNELVVLKPEFDDSNFKRVYKITSINKEKDELFLKIIIEINVKTKKPSLEFNMNELGPYEARLFQSYM